MAYVSSVIALITVKYFSVIQNNMYILYKVWMAIICVSHLPVIWKWPQIGRAMGFLQGSFPGGTNRRLTGMTLITVLHSHLWRVPRVAVAACSLFSLVQLHCLTTWQSHGLWPPDRLTLWLFWRPWCAVVVACLHSNYTKNLIFNCEE